jgi:hypothetical protein
MVITVNNQVIDPLDIDLDPFGWDSNQVRGSVALVVRVRSDELLAIGRTLWDYAQQCLAEEPDCFEGEYREDIPVPYSERMFFEQPELLAVYLDNNFWAREAVMAILSLVIDMTTYNPVPAPYLIQDFRKLDMNAGILQVEFGAVQRGQSS